MATDYPPTYLDKQTSENEKFVFISYCHRDSGWVYPILDKLFSLGLNYWYDKELHKGDLWDEVVGTKIWDERCVGAIVFSSYEYMRSEACDQEMGAIYDKVQKGDFRYFAVSNKPLSPGDILVRSFVMSASEMKEGVIDALKDCDNEKVADFIRDNMIALFPIERAEKVSKLFPINKIWTNTEHGDDVGQIVFNLKDSFFDGIIDSFMKDGAVNSAESLVDELGLSIDDNGMPIVEYASYPIREGYESKGRINGNFVKPVPIEWCLVGVTGDVMTLVSKYSIATEIQAKADEVDKILEKFTENCLSEVEKAAILEKPRAMDTDEYEHYFVNGGMSPVCRFNPIDKRMGTSTSWIVLNQDNRFTMVSVTGKLVRGICPPGNRVGIRPVVKISLTAYKKIVG